MNRNLTQEQNDQINAGIEASRLIYGYSAANFIPHLVEVNNNQHALNDYEDAFYRMSIRLQTWLEVLVKMDNPSEIPGVCSCCRGMLEIYLDALYLEAHPTAAERYKHFPTLLRHSRAMHMQADAAIPTKRLTVTPGVAQYLADTARVNADKAIIDRVFASGESKQHWTGKNTYQMAEELGKLSDYHEMYKYMSTNIHAGPLGNFGETTEQVVDVFWAAQVWSHFYYLETIRIIFRALNISRDIPPNTPPAAAMAA